METGDTRPPGESGLESLSPGDSEPGPESAAPGDTEETDQGGPTSGLYGCGERAVEPAPEGMIRMQDGDIVLDPEGYQGVNAAAGSDIDGDGCAELGVVNASGSTVSLLLLPGPLYGYLEPEAWSRAVLEGEEDHYLSTIESGEMDGNGLPDEWVWGGSPLGVLDDFAGAVYVFAEPLAGPYAEGDAFASVWPPSGERLYAFSVGDYDGDGVGDVAMTTQLPDIDPDVDSTILLLEGPFEGDRSGSDASATITGPGWLGWVLTMESDLDGDGHRDLAAGAYELRAEGGGRTGGAAYVFLGPFSGSQTAEDADWFLPSESAAAMTGRGLAVGGDVDGDGYEDLFVTASAEYFTRVYLMRGTAVPEGTLSDAAATFHGAYLLGVGWHNQGTSLSQDLDADGLSDPALGAQGDTFYDGQDGVFEGAAFLYYGPVSGAHDVHVDADAVFFDGDPGPTYDPDPTFFTVGETMVGLGDTDGDGFDDLLVGSWAAASIFRGGPR